MRPCSLSSGCGILVAVPCWSWALWSVSPPLIDDPLLYSILNLVGFLLSVLLQFWFGAAAVEGILLQIGISASAAKFTCQLRLSFSLEDTFSMDSQMHRGIMENKGVCKGKYSDTGFFLTCQSSWVLLVLAGSVKFNFMAWILKIILMFLGWVVSRGQDGSHKT